MLYLPFISLCKAFNQLYTATLLTRQIASAVSSNSKEFKRRLTGFLQCHSNIFPLEQLSNSYNITVTSVCVATYVFLNHESLFT